MNKTENQAAKAATLLILEANKVGIEELKQRTSNIGIAGNIAHKVINRDKYDGIQLLSMDSQAEKLGLWLTDKEIDYVLKNWI